VEEVPDAYASDLFKEGKVACRCLSPSTHAHPEECRFVIDSFLEAEGKIGISCSWGKDRTGVYCALLEGLAGATYDEIRADFMLSFCNMYHIEEGSTEYDVVAEIIVDRFFYLFDHMECIPHPEDVDWEHIEFVKYNPEEVFTKYLIEHVGLDEGTVQKVKDKLTGRI
jgi:hypothetical protein